MMDLTSSETRRHNAASNVARILTILILIIILAPMDGTVAQELSPISTPMPAIATPLPAETPSLGDYLNPDGTLDLPPWSLRQPRPIRVCAGQRPRRSPALRARCGGRGRPQRRGQSAGFRRFRRALRQRRFHRGRRDDAEPHRPLGRLGVATAGFRVERLGACAGLRFRQQPLRRRRVQHGGRQCRDERRKVERLRVVGARLRH